MKAIIQLSLIDENQRSDDPPPHGWDNHADIVEAIRTLMEAGEALVAAGLDAQTPATQLLHLRESLSAVVSLENELSHQRLAALLNEETRLAIQSFINSCHLVIQEEAALREHLALDLDGQASELLQRVIITCEESGVETVNLVALDDLLGQKRASAKTARAISAALTSLITAIPQSKDWRLSDLAKARALIKAASRDTLRLRNSGRATGDAPYHLQALCREGLRLKASKEDLEKELSFSSLPSVDELMDCVSIIRMSGPFSMFYGRFRGAKRTYLSFAKAKKFSKDDALKTLGALTDFLQKEESFESRNRLSRLFDPHFGGTETDFIRFMQLADFYESLDTELPDPECDALKAFLREAPLAHLDLIPNLGATDSAFSFKALQERIAEADAEVRRLERAISQLGECVHVLRDSDTNPSELRGLASRLNGYIERRLELDEHSVAQGFLGTRFAGYQTDGARLADAISWANKAEEFSETLKAILSSNKTVTAIELLDAVIEADKRVQAVLTKLSETAKIAIQNHGEGQPLREIAARFEAAASDHEGLFVHASFGTALHEAEPHGIGPLVALRLNRDGSLAGLGELCEALVARQLARQIFVDVGQQMTRYSGSKLDELRSDLALQDKELIRLSRQQLRAQVAASAKPPRGNGVGNKSTWTNLALIENEIAKKQRYIPVRDLTQRAGRALLELKPCWMMSPLAVAQYVPKGAVQFDLCIIDEASQMPPEAAIGALVRSSQAVVVGDTNQLPPSSFFKTIVDDEEADEDEAVLNESILEMANGTFRPARRLRWHYRSRHSGLIKFSNRFVYDDNLVVFPSANESLASMGIEFRGVKGRYKAGTNPIEAKATINAAIESIYENPERSLGIVTLNQKQRDLILEEFEYEVGKDRVVQKYIETWKEKNDGLEEFFIKNLENVQGDERDVILIGTVYGPEELGGRVMQRFGPINGLAGKRRLNVLFTRAKQKIVTLSSMTSADIEAEEHGNVGAYMLKRWLEYSASGVLDAGEATGREPESDFEIFVINQIKAMGCIPVPQVGVVGYFVDIGIRHPDWPHGFVLGVECDGATYHSSKSARDRDRLRQEILENLGWKLHRIWSTDWFNNPQREVEKLRKSITERLAWLKTRESQFVKPKSTSASSAEDVRDAEPPLVSRMNIDGAPKVERPSLAEKRINAVEVGDTVRVRYLTDDKRTVSVTISKSTSKVEDGVINEHSPMAKGLLGAEQGDEVEVLVGSYIRTAIIEQVMKPK